ncbi:DUF4105 domain-containing protein [Flavobacteriaceae bacterium GF1]
MRIKQLFLLPFLLLTWGHSAQNLPQLSENAQISVLTCGAGNQLYTAFGHTAFRVQDSVLGLDIVYNYGTFDFDKPNFYLNFAKGKLIYSLSRSRFDRFLFEYEYEKRWVREQLLDLTPEEVNGLFQFFEENYRPENRDYRYDPLFNNCSNITGMILKDEVDSTITFSGDHLDSKRSYRQLVREFIPTNSWGAFGIELAFGNVTDKTATVEGHMFSPYYAMYQLRNTTRNGKPLLKRERSVLEYPETTDQGTFMTSPFFWFIALLGFVLVITYLDVKHGTRHKWLDFLIFLLSGLAGSAILLLWLVTDHVVTKNNFNFLWLLPPNAVVAFLLLFNRKLSWLSNYLKIALGCMGLLVLLWVFGVQSFSPLIIPLMLILVVRYVFLLKRN